jgi:predicted nucleic acid-binding protein
MIFVDTSFWVALRNRRDAHHEEAVDLLTARADDALATTNHVRGETWTYLRRRAGHRSAVGFLDALRSSPRLTVEYVELIVEEDALAWLRRHDEREYSFVDATSFAVMKRRRINEAFAFDGDFAAAGFVELRS